MLSWTGPAASRRQPKPLDCGSMWCGGRTSNDWKCDEGVRGLLHEPRPHPCRSRTKVVPGIGQWRPDLCLPGIEKGVELPGHKTRTIQVRSAQLLTNFTESTQGR